MENYKMLTDQLNITNGKIINFGVAFDVTAHRSSNPADVKLRCINKIIEYFNIDKLQFRQPLYTSDIEYELMGLDGVRAVNWVELTQDFANLSGDRSIGMEDSTILWDYSSVYPSGDTSALPFHTQQYGWEYYFQNFYGDGEFNVGDGIILPSVILI